jgi:hypothetical protein
MKEDKWNYWRKMESILPAHICYLSNKASARATAPTNMINTMLLYYFRCSVKYT